jgi:hypothetical protein
MMKKVLIGAGLCISAAAVTVNAMGGVEWLDSTGMLGQERALSSRVRGYWNARVDNDLERMARFIHPLQGEVSDPGILVTNSYELRDLTIDGDSATAMLKVKSHLKHPILSNKEREVELHSRWVRYEGKWYQDVVPGTLAEALKQDRGEENTPAQSDAQ